MYPLNLKDKNPLNYDDIILYGKVKIREYLADNSDKKWLNVSENYKDHIRKKLGDNQSNKCAYCGNDLWLTSGAYIDHIAPQGEKLYPEFRFERENLVLACDFCNGSSGKHEYDTITVPHSVYRKCIFNIVHPYFDNPDEHYAYLTNHRRNKILIRYKSPKGKNTIYRLHLNSERRVTARYKQEHQLRFYFNRILEYTGKKNFR